MKQIFFFVVDEKKVEITYMINWTAVGYLWKGKWNSLGASDKYVWDVLLNNCGNEQSEL